MCIDLWIMSRRMVPEKYSKKIKSILIMHTIITEKMVCYL